MDNVIIKNAKIVNRGKIIEGDILIKKDRIEKIGGIVDEHSLMTIDATNKWVIPGIIDDQVHFREPGMTYKADIASEARAAVAGGVTSFMEMPNTKPPALTQDLLEDKYQIAANSSLANYSFFMGVSNDNYDEAVRTDPKSVCGLKIFMGSSTGNMLVDNDLVLEKIFANSPMLIATHCEDEQTIKNNLEKAIAKYGDDIPFNYHPVIRSSEGCYISSSKAIELAKKTGARLHILHISTAGEVNLFSNDHPLKQKKITSEVCVHHLSFDQRQYDTLGAQIKCNPAIKSLDDQEELWKGLLDDRLDIIATDHAPHTWEEKANKYLSAPSGLPLVQHALDIMLAHKKAGKISIENIVRKMCHAPADCFQILERGYLDEGCFADVVIVDPESNWEVNKSNIHYKCGWSPLEGRSFESKVETTIVSGHVAYHQGIFYEDIKGKRLTFDR